MIKTKRKATNPVPPDPVDRDFEIPLLAQLRMKRLILGDAELHDQVVEPRYCRSFGVQPVQQRLEFLLTWERVKDNV